jgi:hypothetical protein
MPTESSRAGMIDLFPLLHPAPTVLALSTLRRARAAARRQQARALLRAAELGTGVPGGRGGGLVLRMLGQGHGVSSPTPAAAAVHGFWLLSRHDWAVTPRSGPRGAGLRG